MEEIVFDFHVFFPLDDWASAKKTLFVADEINYTWERNLKFVENGFPGAPMTDHPASRKKTSAEPSERMDIRTIARLANVSIATVSRTINRVSTVNPKMAKRVWDVIEKLDFVPNTQARALVSGRSKLFGLLVSEITNPFFPELIQGFENIAVENGYEILISSTNYDPKRMSHCIRRMLERKVEGVAIMTFGLE